MDQTNPHRNYYAYKGIHTLGNEPLGTANRMLFKLKSDKGAKKRALRTFGKNYRLYRYTNFYDNQTFVEVK